MSDTTNVAELRPSPAKGEGTLRLKDVTAALRAKRYRSKPKSTGPSRLAKMEKRKKRRDIIVLAVDALLWLD